MEIKQYDLAYALQKFLSDKAKMPADIVYDGYVMRATKPFITIEQMQSNAQIISKQREGISQIYRFQIGLHASNSVERMKAQETITTALMFGDVPYYDTDVSTVEHVGFFVVGLTAVTPIPADDISVKSNYHRVYFDVEIQTVKRGCR